MYVVRAFVRLNQALASHKEFARRLDPCLLGCGGGSGHRAVFWPEPSAGPAVVATARGSGAVRFDV